MKRLLKADKQRIVASLPQDLYAVLTGAHNRNGRLFLCGGYIRDSILGLDPKDADVFGVDAEEVQRAGEALGAHRGGAKKTVYSVTAPARESDPPVQFVHTWPVSNAWTAISRMDFTMCQAALWYKGGAWRSVCSDDFYKDVAAKRLRYTWPDREGTAGRSLVRAMNFVARGWKFPADEIAALVAHTSHEVNTPEVRLTANRKKKACYRFGRNVSGLYPIGSKKAA